MLAEQIPGPGVACHSNVPQEKRHFRTTTVPLSQQGKSLWERRICRDAQLKITQASSRSSPKPNAPQKQKNHKPVKRPTNAIMQCARAPQLGKTLPSLTRANRPRSQFKHPKALFGSFGAQAKGTRSLMSTHETSADMTASETP
jgi:hypothetical protein